MFGCLGLNTGTPEHPNTIMNVLIIAHGEPPSVELLRRLASDSDMVIATDGAANTLIPLGILPHVVLGDFDSLDPAVRAQNLGIQYVAAEIQEASDLDKAIAHALEMGAVRLRIAGAAGGRMDHTLTNASLLLKYHNAADIVLVDDRGITRAVAGEATFQGEVGDTLSLIPFAPAKIGWTEGLKWPLQGEALLPGSRGVSNVFIKEEARIRVESGIVLVCHLRNQHLPPEPDEVTPG